MTMMLRVTMALAGAMALTGCALLGGGPKPPPWLMTLAPSAPAPESVVRSANAGEAVTIEVPVIPKELRSVRVPAQSGETAVAYIKGLQWVDTPDRLFQDLLSETVLRTTNRVVIDPKQSRLDPGLVVSGQLTRFGYEAGSGSVLVRYDAALSAAGGTRVETRRFEGRAPADGTAGTVGPALNQAANQVALDVARWIGG
jgi:cholesterol transport system auxiliary component